MKKTAPAALMVLLLLLGGPMFLAAFAAAAQTPAITEQLRSTTCGAAGIQATGQWRPPFQQPYVVTSGYGMRFHPFYHQWRLHTGTDLVSQPGPGPIVAAAAGRVTSAGWQGGYGAAVVVDHGNGVSTLYGHLASITAGITPGAIVSMGQQLGVEGSTGASTGNHLHFEVRVNGAPVNAVPFMLGHGAPLNSQPVGPSTPTTAGGPGLVEGGVGFPLPPPGTPRLSSLTNPALPIPHQVKSLYLAAAEKYRLPWTLLAGIGMEETGHGRTNATSSAGAQGLMQFIPATFVTYGVDGDGDSRADIRDDADWITSAANYLTTLGVLSGGADGVRRAILGYNHATWYVNDVLYYAHAYGGGTVLGDPADCGAGSDGNPDLPPLSGEGVTALLTWAQHEIGDAYVFGANGPDAWDCSSFTRAAYAQVGIGLPRTASAQRDWLGAGNGFKIPYGQERPGDLIFWDSYLGPNQIGHAMIVWDPATRTTIEAHSARTGVGTFTYASGPSHHIFEIWRVGAAVGQPASTTAR